MMSEERRRGYQNIRGRNFDLEETKTDKGNGVTMYDESGPGQQDWSSKGARPKSGKSQKFQLQMSSTFPSKRGKSHSTGRPHSATIKNENANQMFDRGKIPYPHQRHQYPHQRHRNDYTGLDKALNISNANQDQRFDLIRTGSESRLNYPYRTVTNEAFNKGYKGKITSAKSHLDINNHNVTGRVNESNTSRKIVFGFPFLKNLISNEPGYIVLELTKNKTALKECLKRTAENREFLEVFLQVLSKAYLSKSTPGLMIELFDTLKDVNFFDNVVFLLIDMLGKGFKLDSTAKQMIMNIMHIIAVQLTRNPSSLFVVSRACTVLGQIIENLPKDTGAYEEMKSIFQELREQKETLEKGQRSSSGLKTSRKPPDDFRQYPVSPSVSEITSTNRPFLRQNKVEGEYDDLDHYLDVQFRLLREDFVGPLREGIMEYIKMKTSNQENSDDKSVRKLDIKIYENVSVYTPIITEYGLCYKMRLEKTNFFRRENWSMSKRLMYGSLVCLTDNDFNSFFIATVVGRDDDDIRNGYFIVHFEEESISPHDILHKVFQMAESAAYFESYRHTLSSLQTFKRGDLPFEKYILHCSRRIDPPAYLSPEETFDLRPLVDQHVTLFCEKSLQNIGTQIRAGVNYQFSAKSNKAKSVNIIDKKCWPSKELLHLDDSQYEAVQTALTSEFSIIQGPPGTGKTYTGLKIVKALLHNRSKWSGVDNQIRPMLVVCFTNHALDQFLEGIANFFDGDLLRVGGRSENEKLKKLNLKNYRQIHHSAKSQLGKLQLTKRQAKQDLQQQSEELEKIAKTIEIYRSEVVGEDHLREQMGNMLYNNLIDNYRGYTGEENFSYIKKWLGIKRIQKIARREAEEALKSSEEDFVSVQGDTYLRREDMMFDVEDIKRPNHFQLQVLRKQIGVVFYVRDEIKATPKNEEEKKHKLFTRFLKASIIRKITDFDIMSEEEARQIYDIWRLDHNTKWRLYRLWVQKLCISKYEEIEIRRVQFELASERYREAMMQEDREIMSKALVIGMTTTCAARYQDVLRDIGPRIIIIEEAAEVLEAHIVTTLSKSCEQLILIGDHKQLRPNPTVYRLAIRYKLDVSLFERMIKNKMDFNSLRLQHRMRPSISSLVKHIYPALLDHTAVTSYPDIKGVSANLFLVDHEHEENSDYDIRSYSNVYEAQYATQLCQYLLLQGYQRHEITILTTYTGQLMCIRKFMPKSQFEGVKVTVVDNYQGEENIIIILSLVRSNKNEKIGFLKTENRICVALSRAKYGFYILGNFTHLSKYSTLWKEITDEMRSKGCFGNGLKLYCRNHPRDDAIIAIKPEDFKRAPEGGCQKYCDVRLTCGHACKRYCHVLDRFHDTNKCQEPCTKVLCDLGHICPRKCFAECRPCEVPLQKIIPKCGHQQSVPCSVEPQKFQCQVPCEEKLQCGHKCVNNCGEKHTKYCQVKIKFIFPCGHTALMNCADRKTAKCQHPCETVLKCEHICNGTCSTCFEGKVHQPCQHRCKRILVCGHACNDFCKHCPPCKENCENRCVHSKCDKSCGEPCVPCKQKCSWKCQHFNCTKLCSEPCNRPKCNRPCKKLLRCKHKCIGFCGEPCPELCRICDKEKVTEIIFGDEDRKNARFVLLEDCNHIVESRALDKYMHMRNEDNAIQLKCCPICKSTIRKCLRYGKLINQVLEDIERVKCQMIGDTGILERVDKQILKNPITEEFTDSRHRLQALSRHRNMYLTQKHSSRNSSQYQRAFVESLNNLKNGKLYTETQLLSLENQHRLVKAAIDIRGRIKGNLGSSIERLSEIKQYLIILSKRFLARLSAQVGVLSEEEIDDFTREIQRGNAYLHFQKMKASIKSVGKDKEGEDFLLKIEQLITDKERFTEETEKEISDLLKQLKELLKIKGLGITDVERIQIIKAVGLSKGHWFKCPKNHIYAIGECGGAYQKSTCPECKLDIGGVSHRLAEGNKLAPEMDGASFAAYSEEANNMGNFDLDNLH